MKWWRRLGGGVTRRGITESWWLCYGAEPCSLCNGRRTISQWQCKRWWANGLKVQNHWPCSHPVSILDPFSSGKPFSPVVLAPHNKGMYKPRLSHNHNHKSYLSYICYDLTIVSMFVKVGFGIYSLSLTVTNVQVWGGKSIYIYN